jgi:hypothetical protein
MDTKVKRFLQLGALCAALFGAPAGLEAGLVAAYNFDEGSGTTLADASGNGNNGTLAGVVWTASGRHGAAVSFNGSSGSIDVSNSPSITLTGSFTLSAWVKPAALGGYQTVLIKETTGNGSYWLQTLGNQVDSGIFDGTNYREHVTAGANLALDTWYFLASVFDDASNTFTIYVNGTPVLSEAETAAMVANNQNLVFGQSHVGERWNGVIDDLRIYDHALTRAEIQTDMIVPVGGTLPDPDTTPPTCSIISPAGGARLWGVTTLSAVASDAESGIWGVQFRVDGADLGAEVTAAPFHLTWNTTTATPGNHVLTAVARNGYNLTSTSSPVSVTVTGAPPRWVMPSANGRYLVDQDGAPFLITGDAPQSLTVNLSTSEADMYFADRQAHGFNALWVNLLCNDGTAGRADGSTYDGILPFNGYLAGHPGDPDYYDLSQPNPSFFARCDWMINQAARYGLVFFLDPIETIGWLRNDGRNGVLLNNGLAACRAYGQFLGDRYKDFPNIVWMSGNDFQIWSTPAADAVVMAVALGIKDNDPNHIHTVELDYLTSGSLDNPNWAPIISLNASYTYYPTYAQVLNDYNRPNFVPVFMVEANYEFEALQGPVTTAPILRRQEYWTLLSGATGQLYGSHYTWTFTSGWQGFLDSPGALQMPNLNAFFAPRAWYDLVPDQTNSVLTAGYGTFADRGYVADNDYAAAARTADSSLAVVYMPTLRSITIDMTRLSAPAAAHWYDPSSGTYVSIAGSPFANTGTHDFSPPGNNGDGDGDWVLVLETNPPEPVIKAIKMPGIDCLINFTTLAGVSYDLKRTDDVTSVVWSDVATGIPGTGQVVEIADPGAAGRPKLFYRVKSSL